MRRIKKDMGNRQTIRFLNWIDEYPGWWQLICTPNDEHVNLRTMQMIIKQLAKESFYEIILVLLMVHREESFMKDLYQFMLVRMTANELKNGKIDEIIKYLIDYFE